MSRSNAPRRARLSFFPLVLAAILLPALASAQMTLYTSRADVAPTPSEADPGAPAAEYTGLAAYDPLRLTAPDPPQPPINAYTLSIPATAGEAVNQGMALSIAQHGNFLGFSIELSVANNLLGKSGGTLKPEFLNYMANIRNRAGEGPVIRVGGNTQDSSTLYLDSFSNDNNIEKVQVGQDKYGNAVNTPVINYSLDLFYAMSNISSLVDAEWFFGLAFNESDVAQLTENPVLVAEYATRILGSHLRGLIVGNEPDLYVDHSHRPQGWGIPEYLDESQMVMQEILNAGVLTNNTAFVGPSICCDREGFHLTDVLNAGYLSEDRAAVMALVTTQRYPSNNCQLNGVINPQDIFAEFLNHTSAQSLTAPYLSDITTVRGAGKDVVMLEMNSASCGGFPGLSDSFGVAMWMTDWSLQMAYANFSGALMHVGGQGTYYNPFTPPPTTYSNLYRWTTGSVYYPTLVVAEIFGKSRNARIVDLAADEANIYHPAYAVYEGDTPTRFVLFNYISDESGASNLDVTINLANTLIAGPVHVRYFRASSVSEQYNITWAGQTMGTSFNCDGRLYGELETVEVQCTDGNCVINVPAPSIAVVYLDQEALDDSSVPESATATYSTTIIGEGDATVEIGALETGNGQDPNLSGSNSRGTHGQDNAAGQKASIGASVGLGLVAAAGVVVAAVL